MNPFQTFQSNVLPLAIDNVDTDMIIPSTFLAKTSKKGYGQHLFQELREQDPNFVFNQPQYHGASILLSRANFGCGSSREHAVWSLVQAGFRAIIAESFSDIFKTNAGKNNLLTISLPLPQIETWLSKAAQPPFTLSIDLEKQTIQSSDQEHVPFHFDAFRKECFLKGQHDLDYLLEHTHA